MTDALYRTRLRWENGHGVARLEGRSVALTAPPVLAGDPAHYVDWTPAIGCRSIRRRPCDPVEDMTDAEVADADALLALLVGSTSRADPA